MDAVKRGDVKAAQGMVDGAAKAMGYTVGPVFHGTKSKFNQFDMAAARDGAHFFSESKDHASHFGKVGAYYIKPGKIRKSSHAEIDRLWDKAHPRQNDPDFETDLIPRDFIGDLVKKVKLDRKGYGTLYIPDLSDLGDEYGVYMPFNSSQIKSADPVTYDDAGKAIPLSKRFNSTSDDMRNPRMSRANPRQTVTSLLSTVLEPGDRVLDYDRATGEDFYRLYDVIHTDMPLNEASLTEIEGMLDDKGVLCILAGEPPSGLEDHFKKWGKHKGMLMVQGPKNPEAARIAAEKERNS